MNYAARIKQKIIHALQPLELELIDDSQRHHGHTGADARGETHFKLRIIAAAFAGKSRIDRQRLVYEILKSEMQERVHALSLHLKAPGEE